LALPYNESGTLQCGSLTLPVFQVEFVKNFTYENSFHLQPPPLSSPVITPDWSGQHELEQLIKSTTNLAIPPALPEYVNYIVYVIASLSVATLIVIVGWSLYSYSRRKATASTTATLQVTSNTETPTDSARSHNRKQRQSTYARKRHAAFHILQKHGELFTDSASTELINANTHLVPTAPPAPLSVARSFVSHIYPALSASTTQTVTSQNCPTATFSSRGLDF
jgi:hypothetical protein